MTIPVTHAAEALKLSADGYVDLFEITLHGTSTVLRFWNGETRTWQGNSYQQLPCQMSGDTTSSDGKSSRPQLTVVNPSHVFSVYAAEGLLDLALVARKRVLQNDFLNDVGVFQQQVWFIGRVIKASSQTLSVELRQTTDAPVWMTPRRTFNPPDYPFVTLSQ